MYTYANPNDLVELSQREVRGLYPLVSFPSIIEPHHVAGLGLLPVTEGSVPVLGPNEELKQGALTFEDGVITRTYLVVPQELTKEELITLNNAEYERAINALTADYPPSETATWERQRAEAMAWELDPSAPTPWLDIAAAARGLEREEFLRRTLAKVKIFAEKSAWLTGRRQGFDDAIRAASTPEELRAIVIDYSLPEVSL